MLVNPRSGGTHCEGVCGFWTLHCVSESQQFPLLFQEHMILAKGAEHQVFYWLLLVLLVDFVYFYFCLFG